jgi:hypothetical protein
MRPRGMTLAEVQKRYRDDVDGDASLSQRQQRQQAPQLSQERQLLQAAAMIHTALGDILQIDTTAALSHQSQYIGRPTGTAGPVRLYSCTTTTARGYILQIDTTGTAGPVRLYSCTTSTARGYILHIDNTAALSHQVTCVNLPRASQCVTVRHGGCASARTWPRPSGANR